MSSKRKTMVDLQKGASSSSGRGDRGGEGRGERGSGGGQQKRPSVFSRLGTKGAPQGKGKKRGGHGKRGGGGAVDKHKEGKRTSGEGQRHHGQQLQPSSSSSAPGPAPASPAIDLDWENWDEKNLDYDDELMLEKKRQLLQRELARQLQQDAGEKGQSAAGKEHRGTGVAAAVTKVPAHAQQAKPVTAPSSESPDSSDSESSRSSFSGATQRESIVHGITGAVQIFSTNFFFLLV